MGTYGWGITIPGKKWLFKKNHVFSRCNLIKPIEKVKKIQMKSIFLLKTQPQHGGHNFSVLVDPTWRGRTNSHVRFVCSFFFYLLLFACLIASPGSKKYVIDLKKRQDGGIETQVKWKFSTEEDNRESGKSGRRERGRKRKNDWMRNRRNHSPFEN